MIDTKLYSLEGAVCPLMKTVVHHLKKINKDSLGVSGK